MPSPDALTPKISARTIAGPAVALHAVVALLLVWTRRDERRTGSANK